MNAGPPKLADVPCVNDQCEHAREGRCALAEPIAAQKIHWLFALVDCPIAGRAADLLARADAEARLGLLQGDSKIAARQRYRLAALELHDADEAKPGERFIDRVTKSLRSPDAGDRDALAIATIKALFARVAAARRSPRLSTLNRAALATLALIVLLGAVGALIERPSRTSESPRLTAVTTSLRGEVAASAVFDVRVRVNAPLFVSVYLVPASGPIERLFPPLEAPTDLPWPLTASAGECLLPATGSFRGPSEGRGFLVVAPGTEGPPLLDTLENDERDRAAIEREAPGSACFRYEVLRR